MVADDGLYRVPLKGDGTSTQIIRDSSIARYTFYGILIIELSIDGPDADDICCAGEQGFLVAAIVCGIQRFFLVVLVVVGDEIQP